LVRFDIRGRRCGSVFHRLENHLKCGIATKRLEGGLGPRELYILESGTGGELQRRESPRGVPLQGFETGKIEGEDRLVRSQLHGAFGTHRGCGHVAIRCKAGSGRRHAMQRGGSDQAAGFAAIRGVIGRMGAVLPLRCQRRRRGGLTLSGAVQVLAEFRGAVLYRLLFGFTDLGALPKDLQFLAHCVQLEQTLKIGGQGIVFQEGLAPRKRTGRSESLLKFFADQRGVAVANSDMPKPGI